MITAGRGRPPLGAKQAPKTPKGSPRRIPIVLFVDAAELTWIEARAEFEGLSRSLWLRERALKEYRA